MTPSSREAAVPIDPQFTSRWSPRAFTDEALEPGEIASLFEAARWAPSCFNEQPWLFVYGTSPEDRERIVAVLSEGNRLWAAGAPLLGVVFAHRRFARSGKDNRWGAFDSGAASLSLALQAEKLGLGAHFMGGFDAAAAHDALGVPEADYQALAAFAVGHRGDPAGLPEKLRERELVRSDRKSPDEVAHEGRFSG